MADVLFACGVAAGGAASLASVTGTLPATRDSRAIVLLAETLEL
jgi:hypothetical protein